MSQISDWDFPAAPNAALVVLPAANNMIKALRDSNSGATAPPSPVAGMIWFDTSTGLLKQRNLANDAWLILATTSVIKTRLIGSYSVAGLANLTWTSTALTNPAGMYQIVLDGVAPATSGASLRLLTSTNGGASFATTAGDYSYALSGATSAALAVTGGSANGTSMPIALGGASNSSALGVCGTVDIFGFGQARHLHVNSEVSYQQTDGTFVAESASGKRNSAVAVNAILLGASSGNLGSGTVSIYEVIR